jgi:oligoribonuclease NrnB/cAMP/cGMP phosphodiesterase (DHH superfamily)
MSKVLIVTHENCSDGFTCLVILKDKYKNADVLQMAPGKPFPEIDNYDLVIMSDIAFSQEDLLRVSKQSTKLVVLDHHKDNKDCLSTWSDKPDNVEIIFDMNKCGAILSWEYVNPGKDIPYVVKYVDDRDRWIWAEMFSKEINRALYDEGYFSSEQKLSNLMVFSQDQLIKKFQINGNKILYEEKKVINSIVDKHYYRKFGNIKVLFADNCPPYLRSDVGNKLAKKSETNIGAVWRSFEDKTIGVSIRAVGDICISEVIDGARGHPKAAGISCQDIDEFNETFIKVETSF